MKLISRIHIGSFNFNFKFEFEFEKAWLACGGGSSRQTSNGRWNCDEKKEEDDMVMMTMKIMSTARCPNDEHHHKQ